MKTGQTADLIGGKGAARLRPAEAVPPAKPNQPAGPFEVATRGGVGLRETLTTGLLVIYPAFATVAAIVAGLFLTGAGA
jgi:hypothetical protein